MRVLDLFCKAGGASMGYHMAGFDVVGVDIEPQPNYPFKFYQRDALSLSPRRIKEHFDVVVGSPPCLGYTTLASRYPHIKHDKLIPATRDLMMATGLPYVIENVENARDSLREPVRLCGSSFGLRVRRHRLFETSFPVIAPSCNHQWQERHRPYRIHVSGGRKAERHGYTGTVPVHGGGQLVGRDDWVHASVAMGIDWMTKAELNQAIPPLYTYWVGRQLMRSL